MKQNQDQHLNSFLAKVTCQSFLLFFFFFFYMVVVEYIIESWVVFHLEFTSFTTEMMKMTTVTHGMETLLSTHNQMIQDCSKYMESLKFGL